MIKKINTFSEPVLYKKTAPVKPKTSSLTAAVDDSASLWSPEIMDLCTDLVETAESMSEQCLGLAATQIWDKPTPCPRIFVMRWFTKPEANIERGWAWQTIINPLIKTSGKTIKWEEGCLSLPNKVFKKSRKKNVLMTFQTVDSLKPVTMKFFGKDNIVSYVIQHEVAHLEGTLISHQFKGGS